MVTQSYVQTVFDKAFIDVVQYIIDRRKEHKKFRTMKDFMSELGITDKIYISIRSGARGVPKHLIPEITHTLITKYGVSQGWLTFRKGAMFSVPLSSEGNYELSYNDALTEIKILRSENKALREQLADANKMISSQSALLKKLTSIAPALTSKSKK